MATFFYQLFTQLCHMGYKSVRFAYEQYKKIKAKFNGYDLNPYKYMSLYPTDLQLEIVTTHYTPDASYPKYTIIIPVLNEEQNIIDTLKAIEAQTLIPDQVVIVDANSTDKTVSNIHKYQQHSKLDITILSSEKRNISHQRNLAIEASRNNLIVNIDSGGTPDQHYTANLIGPFTEHPDLDLTAGIQYPKVVHPWSLQFTPVDHFYRRKEPYGNCVAYKKDIFAKTGKYPEYVTYAGEDTFLFYKYKKLSKHWIFNKAAFVIWEHPDTFKNAQKKVMNYMLGNFEIGLWPYFYNGTRFNLPLWIGYFFEPFRTNYPKLMQRQADVEINKRHIKGLRFILSKKRITDDKKLQDLAKKMIADNYKVFFVDFTNAPPKNAHPVFIDTDHSLLELIHHKNFNIDDFTKRYGDFMENSVFIIEHRDKEIEARIASIKNTKIEYMAQE